MKKLLGFATCACVVIVLALGSTGCGDKKDKKTTTAPTTGATQVTLQDVKIDAIGDQELPKKGDKTIKIKIADDAPLELTLALTADKIKGEGKIEKGKKEGDLKITVTEGADAKELTVTIAKTDKTNAAEAKFKATYK